MKIKYIMLVTVFLSLTACDCKEKTSTPNKPNTPSTPSTEDDCKIRFRALSNEEIVRETKFCESNGMNASAMFCTGDVETVKIQCEPIQK